MNFSDFQNLIYDWSLKRGILVYADDLGQFSKLVEEVGELGTGLAKSDIEKIIDSIGDCMVVLANICILHGLSIEQCCFQAWNDIKDRKGKMVNGVFVKE